MFGVSQFCEKFESKKMKCGLIGLILSHSFGEYDV